MEQANALILANPAAVFGAVVVIILALIGFIINLQSDLNHMKKRYKKMMTGFDGGNLEKMLNSQTDEVNKVIETQNQMQNEMNKMNYVLQKAITKKSIVRFRAFEDTGSDLSYCVAFLDADDNGVIFSTIFARNFTRSYAKPIEHGRSPHYKLTPEEEQALNEAMNNKREN